MPSGQLVPPLCAQCRSLWTRGPPAGWPDALHRIGGRSPRSRPRRCRRASRWSGHLSRCWVAARAAAGVLSAISDCSPDMISAAAVVTSTPRCEDGRLIEGTRMAVRGPSTSAIESTGPKDCAPDSGSMEVGRCLLHPPQCQELRLRNGRRQSRIASCGDGTDRHRVFGSDARFVARLRGALSAPTKTGCRHTRPTAAASSARTRLRKQKSLHHVRCWQGVWPRPSRLLLAVVGRALRPIVLHDGAFTAALGVSVLRIMIYVVGVSAPW